MAYITADEVRAIRNELKEKFGKDGFKFSVRNSNNMEAIVTLLSGPTDFSDILGDNDHMQINQYHMHQYGKHEAFFREIETIIKTAPIKVGGRGWYNNSDVQSDYFDVAYYYSIQVGNWDKQYVANTKNTVAA